ncbi:MAG: RagB/SusD family nutrient uptake outer membrane protein [Bacteroidales bacterium]|nr:RagB/SusD family nutrient uptake outer membrane protein [Bacteroidales bacterium]
MKLYRIIPVLAALAAFAACTDFDDIVPEGGTMLASQVQETNAILPERASASFNGMLTNIGKPIKMYEKPDDWEFLMMLFCNDLEGCDALIADNNYNWFSVCGEYSSRNADYRNPYIRYRAPYNMIADVNSFLGGFDDNVSDPESVYMIAQAHAIRAYSYMLIAPAYQFVTKKDAPCIPLLSDDVADFTHNPRATVAQVYKVILDDLDYAVAHLDGYARPTKAYINKAVALGLRARAHLDMKEYQEAYNDASDAIALATAAGIRPKTVDELSVALEKGTAFESINEPDWIWGYDMTKDLALTYRYATTSSWLRSFSAWAYAPACQCYTCINKMLYDKIPDTDIRKQWWVDDALRSKLITSLTWDGHPDVANYSDGGDTKLPFVPYTNVKFGCNPIGTVDNDEDMPLMRIDEMYLIQAECLLGLNNAADAKSVLETYVQTYRDPAYTADGKGLSLADEIWFQRRVELWGEGFGIFDTKRLGKPLVRFHDDETSTNYSAAFRFNMEAEDGWLLMRFPQGELDTNFSVVDNKDGELPKTDQLPLLRDGVTD